MVSCSYFLWTETLSDLGRKEAFIRTEEVNKTHKGLSFKFCRQQQSLGTGDVPVVGAAYKPSRGLQGWYSRELPCWGGLLSDSSASEKPVLLSVIPHPCSYK